MPGTTSTALPSFSHDQHHETDADKRQGEGAPACSDDRSNAQFESRNEFWLMNFNPLGHDV